MNRGPTGHVPAARVLGLVAATLLLFSFLTLVPGTVPGGAQTLMTFALNPPSGMFGDTIEATGEGWLQNVAGTITLGPKDVPFTADSNGSFVVSFTVPGLASGTYRALACQDCLDVDPGPSESQAFTVLPPTLSLASSSGIPGQSVVATGAGWDPALGPVHILFGQSTLTGSPPAGTFTPGPDGKLSSPFPIPYLSPDTYAVYACQGCKVPTAPRSLFTVDAATLFLDPSSGAPGQGITATGQGWNPADGGVSFFFGEVDPEAQPLRIVPPDADGSIDAVLKVPPSLSVGPTTVTACQTCGDPVRQATQPFTVLAVASSGGGATGGTGSSGHPGGVVPVSSTKPKPWIWLGLAFALLAAAWLGGRRWLHVRGGPKLAPDARLVLFMGEPMTAMTPDPAGGRDHALGLVVHRDPGSTRIEEGGPDGSG